MLAYVKHDFFVIFSTVLQQICSYLINSSATSRSLLGAMKLKCKQKLNKTATKTDAAVA